MRVRMMIKPEKRIKIIASDEASSDAMMGAGTVAESNSAKTGKRTVSTATERQEEGQCNIRTLHYMIDDECACCVPFMA